MTDGANSNAESWPQYLWRPIWGLVSAGAFALTVLAVLGVVVFGSVEQLEHIPAVLSGLAILFGVPGAILGAASWKRGEEKVERIRQGGGL